MENRDRERKKGQKEEEKEKKYFKSECRNKDKRGSMKSKVRVLLAVLLCVLGTVGTVEKLPLEELHSDDGKDEHEELIDDQDVEDVLQRRHHTIKHRLGERDT